MCLINVQTILIVFSWASPNHYSHKTHDPTANRSLIKTRPSIVPQQQIWTGKVSSQDLPSLRLQTALMTPDVWGA